MIFKFNLCVLSCKIILGIFHQELTPWYIWISLMSLISYLIHFMLFSRLAKHNMNLSYRKEMHFKTKDHFIVV